MRSVRYSERAGALRTAQVTRQSSSLPAERTGTLGGTKGTIVAR